MQSNGQFKTTTTQYNHSRAVASVACTQRSTFQPTFEIAPAASPVLIRKQPAHCIVGVSNTEIHTWNVLEMIPSSRDVSIVRIATMNSSRLHGKTSDALSAAKFTYSRAPLLSASIALNISWMCRARPLILLSKQNNSGVFHYSPREVFACWNRRYLQIHVRLSISHQRPYPFISFNFLFLKMCLG